MQFNPSSLHAFIPSYQSNSPSIATSSSSIKMLSFCQLAKYTKRMLKFIWNNTFKYKTHRRRHWCVLNRLLWEQWRLKLGWINFWKNWNKCMMGSMMKFACMHFQVFTLFCFFNICDNLFVMKVYDTWRDLYTVKVTIWIACMIVYPNQLHMFLDLHMFCYLCYFKWYIE